MATEQVEIINIETKKATNSLTDLKKEVKDLKGRLLELQEGSAEYNKVLVEIGDKMHQLKEITRQTNQTSQDFGDKMTGLSSTIGGLSGAASAVVGTMSLMGVEMGDDIKLLKTLQSLMAITSGIQALDKGVKGFKAMTIAVKATVTAMKAKKAATIADTAATEGATVAQHGLNAAIKANPIGAIVAIIMAAVMAVAALTAGIKKLIQAFGKSVDPVEAAKEQMAKYTAEAEKMKDQDEYALRMAKAMGKSAEEIRKMRKEQALANAEMAKANYLEIQSLYNSASKKQRKEMQEDLDAAREEWKAAQKNIVQVQRDINVELAEERTAARKKEKEERDKAAKQAVADAKARAKAEMEAANKAIEDGWKRRQAIADEMAARVEDNEIALLTKLEILKEKQALVKKDSAEWAELQLQITKTTREIEANTEAREKQNREAAKLTAQIQLQQRATEQAAAAAQREHEIETEYLTAYQRLSEDKQHTRLEEIELERQHQQALFDLESQRLDDEAEALQFQLDNKLITQLEYNEQVVAIEKSRLEMEREISKAAIDNAKAEAEAKTAIQESYCNAVKSITGSLATIIGGLADTMEEGTKQWKNLKIAEATISMLAGMADAFMGMVKTIPGPAGLVAGGLAAAAVGATGAAQINAIRNTQINKDSAAAAPGANAFAYTTSSTAVQGLVTDVQNVRQTTTASDEENMQNTRVYVLESDIARAQGNKRTTVRNSKF